MFKGRHDIGTGQFEGCQSILERQNRQDFAHCHGTFVNAGTDTATILDGDLIPFASFPQHGIGNQGTHGAFHRAAAFTRSIGGRGEASDLNRANGIDRTADFGYFRQNVFGRFDTGIKGDRFARPCL
jgi:hypothetical protein